MQNEGSERSVYNAEKTEQVPVMKKSENGVGEKPIPNGRRRKLIIHFDIRNTVLVADSITNVSMEQALNSFLTGVAWGKCSNDSNWHWHSFDTSLRPPEADTTTFYKFLEKKLVKTPSDRTALRIATGDFTQTDLGKGFLPVFQSHLKFLRWKFDDVPKLSMSGQNGKLYHYILPSVYQLIHKLEEDQRDYAIVFRTYGLDAKNVMSSMNVGLSGQHPGFPTPLNLSINLEPGSVTRDNNNSIIFKIKDGKSPSGTSQYSGDREIFQMLNSSNGITGYKDDFLNWQNNNYHHRNAKPFYVDPYNDDVHHIFFDDNIRTFEHDSIVDVRVFESEGCKSARSLSNTEAAKFEHVCMVQADLLEAIRDTDYYVKSVTECERNYAEYLADWHSR